MRSFKTLRVVAIEGEFLDGQIIKTKFALTGDDPYTHIPITIEGDRLKSDHDTLKELAKEALFKAWFVDRAMPEAIQKVEEMDAKLKEVTEITEIMDTKVAEATNTFKAELESVKALFVKSSDLSDEDKEALVSQFDEYQIGVAYEAGKILNVDGVLYRVVQAHTSQEDWNPTSTASIYTPYLTPTIVDEDGTETKVVNEFKQPTGAHDTYQKGDKVLFKSEVYESLIDNNAYSPEAYAQGWKKIEA